MQFLNFYIILLIIFTFEYLTVTGPVGPQGAPSTAFFLVDFNISIFSVWYIYKHVNDSKTENIVKKTLCITMHPMNIC